MLGDVAWVAQRPSFPPGTLRDAVTVHRVVPDDRPTSCGARPASDARLHAAAARTGFDTVVASLPDGWATVIGRDGLGLSVGQRQRLALTAALVSDASLVILDEPTAHLDARSEEALVATARALRDEGRAVLVVAHRPALVAACDRAVEVTAAPLAAAPLVPASASDTARSPAPSPTPTRHGASA